MSDLIGLREFAPPGTRTREVLEAQIAGQPWSVACKELGMESGNARRLMRNLKAKAAKQGYSPKHDMTRTVPEGFHVKGVSTYYDEDGNPRGQWVKSGKNHQDLVAALQEAVTAMGQSIKPIKPRKRKPKFSEPDLLNCFVITDYHLGMKAFHEETRGEDWDTDIAEQLLIDWFAKAIDSAPQADTAVFAQLGDFLHWDGLDAVTPQSKHILDADTRFQRLVRVAIRVIRAIVTMLLDTHQNVRMLMCEGNHDQASSVWLREFFAALYDNEPRVIVDQSADPYYCVEHGKTALFFHHGHKRLPKNQLDRVFTAKFREVFGRTKHNYGHTGHLHHDLSIESPLMIVRQHRTLAANDAYASRGGWVSGRDAPVITYHTEYGKVAEATISPDMARAA